MREGGQRQLRMQAKLHCRLVACAIETAIASALSVPRLFQLGIKRVEYVQAKGARVHY